MEKNQEAISAQLMKWEKFTIEEKPIGEGSFGEIFKGKWAEQNVVLKKLKGTHLPKDVIIGEINTLGRLHNKHIVLALGATMDLKGDLYLVMEYSKNGSLYTALHRNKLVLRIDEILQLGLDVAKGLAYLHEHDPMIIHRDIKSDNILLFSNRTRAKISDFGTAKLLGEDKFARTCTGTLGYMAPEIHDDRPYTEKIDVYALGVVLFEMVCKQSLAMTWELRRDKITANVKDERLRNLILNCCKHNPNDRPTMKQVVVILRQMHKSLVSSISPNTNLSRLQCQVAVHCFQGQDKLKKQDYKGALEDLNKADELQPNNPATLVFRGVAKLKLGDIDGALEDISSLAELSPRTVSSLNAPTSKKLTHVTITRAKPKKKRRLPSQFANTAKRDPVVQADPNFIILASDTNTVSLSSLVSRGVALLKLEDRNGALEDISLAELSPRTVSSLNAPTSKKLTHVTITRASESVHLSGAALDIHNLAKAVMAKRKGLGDNTSTSSGRSFFEDDDKPLVSRSIFDDDEPV